MRITETGESKEADASAIMAAAAQAGATDVYISKFNEDDFIFFEVEGEMLEYAILTRAEAELLSEQFDRRAS